MKGFKTSVEAGLFTMSLSLFLAVTAAAPMALWIFGKGERDWDAVRIGALPLGLGSILLSLIAFVAPAMAGPIRLAFPLNLTFPFLFGACSMVGALVLWVVYPPIGLLGDVARYDQLWARWDVLGVTAVYHMVVLTGAVLLTKKEEPS